MSTGIVYLIQPCELIKTNRYKIGMSRKTDLSRMKAYKNGTRYIFICECKDALKLEKILIKAFNKKYTRIAGREYFEINEPEELMIEYFISIVMNDKKIIYNNANNYIINMSNANHNYDNRIEINEHVIDVEMEDCSNSDEDSREEKKKIMHRTWMDRFSFNVV